MKELSDIDLVGFRDRARQAASFGYTIGLAEVYQEALVAEVGQGFQAPGEPLSAVQLAALADEALRLRAGGEKVAAAEVKAPKPAVIIDEVAYLKTEEPKSEPEAPKEPEAAPEAPAAEPEAKPVVSETKPATSSKKKR